MREFAYARVSSIDQNEERQIVEFKKLCIPENQIYVDKISGKSFDRPQYEKLLKSIKNGDLLYILSIDRLGRDYCEIQSQWRQLTKDIGVDICVIDMPLLDTRTYKDLMGTFIADMVLQVLSFVAESERNSIKIRQRQGIDAAKARGVRFGRPKCNLPADYINVIENWRNGNIKLNSALKRLNISRSTFYRYVKYL